MWCWSPQIDKHAQCQLVKYMKWPDSLDYKIFWKLELPGKIFLKHYFVINDFSDIVFFKKRFIPHMEVFFSIRALSSWYFNLEFLKTGHEWVLGVNIFWYCTFRFTCSKQEHQYLSWQTLIFFWKLNSYAVVQLYVQPNSLDGPLIGTGHIVVTCNVPVSCLKQIAFDLKSKSPSSFQLLSFLCISGQSLPLWKLGYQPGGGTLGISGWGCAAWTLEPLAYTRASSAEFCYPILE